MRIELSLACGALLLLQGCGGDGAPARSARTVQSGAANGSATTAPASPGDGPFGLDLRAGPRQLGATPVDGSEDKGFYNLPSVPRPQSDFLNYSVVAFDGTGICEVRASTAPMDGDSLGGRTRTAVDELAEVLTTKYGKARKSDLCGGGEVACEEQFWAMSIMNGERDYSYEWTPPTADQRANRVRKINLWVTSTRFADPIVRLDYATNDEKACKAAERAARSSAL